MKKKIIFWNVDTSKDFMDTDGLLPVPNAELIRPILGKITTFANNNDYQVINSCDAHFSDSDEISETPDFKTTFNMHCERETSGMEFIPEVSKYFNDDNSVVIDWMNEYSKHELKDASKKRNIILYKDKFDVFIGNKHTNGLLDIINPDLVYVYGVATDICVNYTVLGLLKRNIKVSVIVDAIKELPNSNITEIVNKWVSMGAKLINFNNIRG